MSDMLQLMYRVFLQKLPTCQYMVVFANRIGHEIGTEKVLNFGYVSWVGTLLHVVPQWQHI